MEKEEISLVMVMLLDEYIIIIVHHYNFTW